MNIMNMKMKTKALLPLMTAVTLLSGCQLTHDPTQPTAPGLDNGPRTIGVGGVMGASGVDGRTDYMGTAGNGSINHPIIPPPLSPSGTPVPGGVSPSTGAPRR